MGNTQDKTEEIPIIAVLQSQKSLNKYIHLYFALENRQSKIEEDFFLSDHLNSTCSFSTKINTLYRKNKINTNILPVYTR